MYGCETIKKVEHQRIDVLEPFLGCEDPLEKGRLLTLVFWPREFHGLISPWGGKESDMT